MGGQCPPRWWGPPPSPQARSVLLWSRPLLLLGKRALGIWEAGTHPALWVFCCIEPKKFSWQDCAFCTRSPCHWKGQGKGSWELLRQWWALSRVPSLVFDRHSPWEVRLLHACPKVVSSESLRGWRGRPDGAGCALICTATYLRVQGGDRAQWANLGGEAT